ncbi:MAG: flagellin FliC [Betaproteobacteria bacterium HGW-Betaproteobacteria-4]|jgi:flagellin|nr:MAG: flagellin FliC [Betaproteobacteria bacterium HGW-Betaproteobacteria-4]
MASTINTNTYSLNAQTNLAKNSLGLRSALERLSSGLRVNSARDDATGLASGMQIEAASRITQIEMRQEGDKISSAQIADGALSVVGDIVTRIMELNKMGGGATEIGLLVTQASTIQTDANAAITKFGGTSFTAIAVTSTADATTLTSVSTARTTQGATMNNAEFAIQSKQVSYENQQAARSRIMDADFAEETSRLSRFQILQQAGTAMVAQANAIPQNVLTLLR